MTISAEDVRQLLATDGDAVLVLIEGRTEVVTAGKLGSEQYRGALEIISRDELLKRTGAEPGDRELEEQAAALNTAVDELGG
jgi:NADH dehydrogenase